MPVVLPMVLVFNPLVLVGPLLSLVTNVANLAETARRHTRKCNLLKERVEMIGGHLKELQQLECTPDPATKTMLELLRQALVRAEDLVMTCQRKKRPWDFVGTPKKIADFAAVQESISQIMQNFHIANRILLLRQNNERIFTSVLETLLHHGACRRLPQDAKEVLLASVSGLTNCDYMSPDQKKVLEMIKRDLRDASSRSTPSGGRGQDKTGLLRQVTGTAEDIVGEAERVKHNREEVQWVAQLAQQVLFLLQDQQAPELIRSQDARQQLENLQHFLRMALHNVRSTHQLGCGPAVMSTKYLRRQAKQMSELANKIELCFQLLTFAAMRQMRS